MSLDGAVDGTLIQIIFDEETMDFLPHARFVFGVMGLGIDLSYG